MSSNVGKRAFSKSNLHARVSHPNIKAKVDVEVDLKGHPAGKYILATQGVPLQDFRKFVSMLYQGLFYSVCSSKGPSLDYIKKKAVKLPEV